MIMKRAQFTRKRNREKWPIITKHQNKRYIFLKKTYRLWKRAGHREKRTGHHEKGTGHHLKKGGRSALWKGPSWNTVQSLGEFQRSSFGLVLYFLCHPTAATKCHNPKLFDYWKLTKLVKHPTLDTCIYLIYATT